jgi:hypothetical protein
VIGQQNDKSGGKELNRCLIAGRRAANTIAMTTWHAIKRN